MHGLLQGSWADHKDWDTVTLADTAGDTDHLVCVLECETINSQVSFVDQ